MKTKKIQKSLQTLVDYSALSQATVSYIEPSEEGDGYWHYREESGYGFSTPNFDDFIVDVLYEVSSNIELVNNNPNAFGFSKVSKGWNTKRKIKKILK